MEVDVQKEEDRQEKGSSKFQQENYQKKSRTL